MDLIDRCICLNNSLRRVKGLSQGKAIFREVDMMEFKSSGLELNALDSL